MNAENLKSSKQTRNNSENLEIHKHWKTKNQIFQKSEKSRNRETRANGKIKHPEVLPFCKENCFLYCATCHTQNNTKRTTRQHTITHNNMAQTGNIQTWHPMPNIQHITSHNTQHTTDTWHTTPNTKHTTHNKQHATHNMWCTTHNTKNTQHMTHNTQHSRHNTQHTADNTQHTKQHNTEHTTDKTQHMPHRHTQHTQHTQ